MSHRRNYAVVYDPLNQKCFKDDKDKYLNDQTDNYVTIDVSKSRKTVVDLYVPMGNEKVLMFLATIDLKRLGHDVKSSRRRGKIQEVYVLGQDPLAR